MMNSDNPKMKESIYNFFQKKNDDKNEYIAYNSYSSALALITAEEYDYIKNLSESKNQNGLEESFIRDLEAGGFIVDAGIDELDLVRERMLRARYNSSSLGLTIAPTLDCNFRCIYCYEKECKKDSTMTLQTQECIISFVEGFAPTINRLDITWYGGEPLLAMSVIENLSIGLKKICSKYKIDYRAAIITNGYLLKPDIVKRLVDYNITFCQITVDGSRDEHNSRRPHVTGCDSYDRILENAREASRYFDVSIRVNMDKNNQDAILSVRKLFDVKKTNVVVYPAPIRPHYECHNGDVCFKTAEFMRFEHDYYLSLNDVDEIMRKYPQRKSNSCCADSLNAYVIAPNGDLYKCWSDMGRSDKCIGNIVLGTLLFSKSILYSKYDATRDDRCRTCKFLPICMGGCPRDAMEDPAGHCLFYNTIHEDYLNRLVAMMEDSGCV